MTDPIEKLAEIFPNLQNGQKLAIKDVKASILEMRATIADLESTLARQPLPEAPASLSAKVVDPITQIEWQVTVREARAGVLLISAMPSINEALAERGLIALDAYYIDGRRAERESNKALPGESAHWVPNGPNQPTKNQPTADALTFKAENLTKSTEGDKTYYKVKGGKFAQFGVTVWPEVLAEAGFDLDTLGGVTPLTGYTAHYILNENSKPAKVVGLERA